MERASPVAGVVRSGLSNEVKKTMKLVSMAQYQTPSVAENNESTKLKVTHCKLVLSAKTFNVERKMAMTQ